MREYHCDALKTLEVPDEMIERALTIPASFTAARESAKTLKRLVAAAAVVLIAGLGTLAYYLIKSIDDMPLAVAPADSADDHTRPTAAGLPRPATQPPTEEPAAYVPTIQPTAPVPTQPPVPATLPVTPPTDAPVDDPPEAFMPPTERPAEQTVPYVEPTVPIAEPPTEEPIVPAIDPTEPNDAPDPTAPPPEKEIVSVGYMVPISSYTGSEALYCRLYGSDGSLVGDENLYDESHRVYFTTGSGYLFLSYPLSAVVGPLPPDTYTIVFYDVDGNDFYFCSAFLNRR